MFSTRIDKVTMELVAEPLGKSNVMFKERLLIQKQYPLSLSSSQPLPFFPHPPYSLLSSKSLAHPNTNTKRQWIWGVITEGLRNSKWKHTGFRSLCTKRRKLIAIKKTKSSVTLHNGVEKQSIAGTWFGDMGEALETEMSKTCLKLRLVAQSERA